MREALWSLCSTLAIICHINRFLCSPLETLLCSSIAQEAVPGLDACHSSPQELSTPPHPLCGTLQLQPLYVRLRPLNMQLQQHQAFGHGQGPSIWLPKTWAGAAGGPGRRGQGEAA